MFHPEIIARKVARLETALGTSLVAGRLQEIPVDTCHSMAKRLAQIWDPDKRQQTRALSQDEQEFVANERLMTKCSHPYWAQRYCLIQSEGQTLKPMYPLWESQRLIMEAVAQLEQERWATKHPDGICANLLKGRQLGASTWTQSVLAHGATTHSYTKCLIASDVPENSGSQGLFGMLELVVANLPWWLKPSETFHTKDKHIVWKTGSSVIVESGKSMKGGLTEEGGHKGNIGRSKTYSKIHLSELSTWERPEQIDDGLDPAVPRTPRTFWMRESTAKGRHNWWHREWQIAEKGLGRCTNIFIPWYAERTKYWLPVPASWSPLDDTLEFARRVEEHGPKYMHRKVVLDPEQLVWYERKKLEANEKGELFKFLEEYPAEPEEAFQFSGRSIFPILVIDRVEQHQKPLIDLLTVRPHTELLADHEAMIAELATEQREMQQRALVAAERHQAMVVDDPEPVVRRFEQPAVTPVDEIE